MADFLATKCVGWLADVFEDNISQSITYTRGSTTVTLSATPASLNNAFSAAIGGTQLQLDAFDFIVKQSSLGLEPREGDKIVYGGNEYRVCKPDEGTRVYDDDEYGTTYTIHTKFFGAAT